MKDTIKFLQPAVSGVALGLLAATTADIAHALELGAQGFAPRPRLGSETHT